MRCVVVSGHPIIVSSFTVTPFTAPFSSEWLIRRGVWRTGVLDPESVVSSPVLELELHSGMPSCESTGRPELDALGFCCCCFVFLGYFPCLICLKSGAAP